MAEVSPMTAPFAADLCGFRFSGLPSTSDSNDPTSVEWGQALFDELDVRAGKPEVSRVGDALESAVAADLGRRRPDVAIGRSRPAIEFEQYRHLGVSAEFAKTYGGDLSLLERAISMAETLPSTTNTDALVSHLQQFVRIARADDAQVRNLIAMLPQESLLRLDIGITAPPTAQRLLVGLSAKWSLRTDRAQDCIAQGAKLVNLRRGQMPHYAVLTMEPRPSMLRLLAYGSGSLDCVYHLALDELRRGATLLATKRGNPDWPPRMLLERMVLQGRVRPYRALVDEVRRLPA
jgi:hypothetical protein